MGKHRNAIAVLLVVTAAVAMDRTWERSAAWRSPGGERPAWLQPTAATDLPAPTVEWLRHRLTWRDHRSPRALVMALDSGQPKLAVAARDVAHEKIDEWQLLPAAAATVRLGELATHLQAQLPGDTPDFAALAVELMSRIAACCPDAALADRVRKACFTIGPIHDESRRGRDGGGDHARDAIARDFSRVPWPTMERENGRAEVARWRETGEFRVRN